MKRFSLSASLVMLLFSLASVAVAQGVPGNDNRWIIGWKATTAKVARESRLSVARVDRHQDMPEINATVCRMSPEAAMALKRDPSVRYVVPDIKIHLLDTTPNDSLFSSQWGLSNSTSFYQPYTGEYGVNGGDIHAKQAWDIETGDSTLMIGLIDTGIDYNHPDLVNNIWTNPGEVPGNGVDDDGNGYVDDVHGYDFMSWDLGDDPDPYDNNMHGTHCAGIIAGRGNDGRGTAGVMWKANIVAIKAFNACGEGYLSDAFLGNLYARKLGCKITSNSWGGWTFRSLADGYPSDPHYQPARDCLAALDSSGVLFVVAAGNDLQDMDTSSQFYIPAADTMNNMLVVGATRNTDQFEHWFSNYGDTAVDVSAPGSYVISTIPTAVLPGDPGSVGYRFLSGTSMATPHVAGIAGLLKSKYPYLSNKQLKAMIMGGVDKITTGSHPLTGKSVTEGRVNASKALLQPKGAISQSDIYGAVILTTTSSGVPALSWTCTIRDSGGVPVPNVDVVLNFTNADSVLMCDVSQYTCSTKSATATTDAYGVANFHLAGKVLDCDGGNAALAVDGAGWGGLTVCAIDLNENGTLDGNDLSIMLAIASNCVKGDMDGNGTAGDGNDLSIFLDHFYNDGTGGCTSPDTLCARTGPQQSPWRAGMVQDVSKPLPTMLMVANQGGSPQLLFSMSSAGPAKVEVFDVAGRRVATLFDGQANAGVTRLSWSSPLSPGAYFARFTAGSVRQDKKIAVLR